MRPLAHRRSRGAFYHGYRLMGDARGFFSYVRWKRAASRGIRMLARVPRNTLPRPIEHLPDGSFGARIYPSAKARRGDEQAILARAIRYTLDEPGRTGHGEVHVLVTNLLDAESFPAEELIVLYHERGEHELVIDEQKTHHDPRPAHKPAQLRSQTPAGVVQEMIALSLGHFVARA